MIKLDTVTAYDLKETSELLHLNIQTVRKYIKIGKIKAQKVGRNYYVTDETIADFIKGE